MIVYDTLKAHRFEPVYQTYTARDCMLYALGLNIGADPLDPVALRYVAAEPPLPVVTMPMNLARLGPWMKDPAVGIDYTRIMVGEVSLRLHAPQPVEGAVCGQHRVVRVTDKGEGRGALVTVRRDLTDAASGQLLAEYEQVTFCRADGGFATDGRHDPAPTSPAWDTAGREPDRVIAVPTSPQQALVYRLSGDMNPLHADPAVARKAGFDRPILHGLSIIGMAGHALRDGIGDVAEPLTFLSARFTAPVFPGDQLRLEAWRGPVRTLFRLVNSEGREVLGRGVAEFHHVG